MAPDLDLSHERAIRAIVAAAVSCYAEGFADRHIAERDNPNGTINLKVNNIFISTLGGDIPYYSALCRSLDSSLGNMLENMAFQIAKLSYDVSKAVEGHLYSEQVSAIATLLETYKRHGQLPLVTDYANLHTLRGDIIIKRHESDYCLYDRQTGLYYLIELKIGGDLDNKKARSEKESILEQYCILANRLGSGDKIKLLFATAYNRFGEGTQWKQTRVLQFFAQEELCISRDFWNFVCRTERGYDIVIDEYKAQAHYITDALNRIKTMYITEEE